MLAYVFWHWPVILSGYEDAVLAFHRALASDPPAGFRGSRVFRIGPRPWLAVARAYEDWYFVADFASLGALNDAAVAGTRKAPHDDVATRPAGGLAALYGHVSGEVAMPRHAAFRAKPATTTYSAYLPSLPPSAEVWQRKMVLGPSPEFCLLTDAALDDSSALDCLHHADGSA